ncbi:hypothetical protein J2TS6_25890 [Paenibacillus albilobatus]|uniref:DUF5704 domain-containing protein n=2 Tax=Paenibacillus TaxID=44249 RepID=A0A919XHG8_9BACL|nr:MULTISPECIES: DUF5704 domain-containing protein [Paenibacillus]GIO31448.1 hypothetical protein J2TS6_25890 [Paenibacillus albilobatus]
MLFKIELATQLNVKYFTTDGNPLNIFTPRINEEMTVGKDYSFTPPTHQDYEYVGFKKSTTDAAPSGSITPGNPYSFQYDGSFEKYTLYMYYKKKDGTDNGCPPGQPCEPPPPTGPTCTKPAPAQTVNGQTMDPNVSAVIKADSRGSEKFDVLQGIPTSESLYGNVKAKEYLYQNAFTQMKGVCTFEVKVKKTYILEWDPGKKVPNPDGKGTHEEPDPQREPVEREYAYTIQRPYSFWKIDNLEVYDIDRATLTNYAWDTVTIQPTGYHPPVYAATQDGNYFPPDPPGTLTAPSETKSGGKTKPSVPNEQGAFQGMAEQAVKKVEVRNDSLVFKGQAIMNGTRTQENGPTPSRIPEPTMINDNVLYSPGHVISKTKTNKSSQPSTGEIFYNLMDGSINGGSNRSFPIPGINPVTVHTPVVIYASTTDDKAHNQKTNPAGGRNATILDRPFTIYMPTNGQHLNIPGYGNRDYAKYVRDKQVKFPFDVYTSDKSRFIPKNTWVSIPVMQTAATFFLPVWVDEGFYDIQFRAIAENAPTDFTAEPQANLNLAHHAATDTVPVDVIGRLYDFHVTDIADYNWEKVFRTQAGSANPTGVSYWVGQNEIDGDPRGNKAIYTLPIRPGSHPLQGYKNVSVKTGYHFKFDFKTKGNMFGPLDGIRITPAFYFVGKDGKAVNAKGDTRIPVDLYYNAGKNNFVKIGSAQDQVKRYVILNDRLRNVPTLELSDTAAYKYGHDGQAGNMGKNEYIQNYMQSFTKQKTPVGSYSLMILPEQLRTFLRLKENIPASVDPERANVSVQKWYGEYSLPAEPFVVEAGTNVAEYGRTHGGLDSKSPIFLKNGYIIVNFNIESIRQGDLNHPYLQYIHAPLMNQWQLEGFNRSIQDAYGHRFTLKDGDILFYHADKSSRDDFSSQVPH